MDPYQPVFVDSSRQLLEQAGRALHDVVGTMLERTWVVWDKTDDEWWGDAPVLLEFSNHILAIRFRRLDEMSVTSDCIDINKNPGWLIDSWNSDEYEYEWRVNALPELSAVVGQELRQIQIVWHDRDLDEWGLYGLTFHFVLGVLEIFNAFDGEVGLSRELLEGRCYKREPL